MPTTCDSEITKKSKTGRSTYFETARFEFLNCLLKSIP